MMMMMMMMMTVMKQGSSETRRPRLGDAKFVERLLGVRGGLQPRHLQPREQRPQSLRDRR